MSEIEYNHIGCLKSDSYAFPTCLCQLQMSTFADSAKMWWLEITAKITESNGSIMWVIFQPVWIASVYRDSRKWYIVKTKLTPSPRRFSVVLAMWGLHANNFLRPVLEKVQRYHQLPKDSIFYAPQKQNSKWSESLAACSAAEIS